MTSRHSEEAAMSDRLPSDETLTTADSVAIEPERYELREAPAYVFALERRDFLRVLGAMGGGLLVVATLPADADADQGRGQSRGGGAPAPAELAQWLHIGESGAVTAFTGKVEMGQNVRTSLSQAIADELRVTLSSVSLVMADTDLTPYDQGTFGSRTTPTMAPQLARAAASAREMLIDLAAARWQTDRASLTAAAGRIVAADGRALTYGELTKGQKLAGAVSPAAAEMPRDRWRVRGTAAKKIEGAAFVTGTHEYASDITRPGLLIGRVVRSDVQGATPEAVDDSAARAMPGVTVIRDDALIGVVAPTERAAKRAAAAVQVRWRTPQGQPDSETIYEHLRRSTGSGTGAGFEGGGSAPRVVGDVEAARRTASRVFDATYHIPYIAHVPMEPRAAVAEWQGDRVTVWCGTQRPFGVRADVAQALRLSAEQVRVIVPDVGGAYGGKQTSEHAIEAARLAKAAGRPVKLVYTRAEEFNVAYLRPAGVIDVRAAVDAAGQLTLWEFDNWNSGSSGIQTPYRVANQRVVFHSSDSPFRQGSYRGLAATANNYVREMHMDAVARALGADAVEFRLRHLDTDRLRAVLSVAADKAGWPAAASATRALGIACGTEKGSFTATAAAVSRTATGFAIDRLVVVFECGAIVNPDGLRNQVEGAVVQGLGGALFEKIEFAGGRLLNGTMAQYRVPRFKDIPPIEIVTIDRRDLPSAGAGETPIIGVAPAIGSAVRAFGPVAARLPVELEPRESR
jgi:isoquinoline 1-oxidoreductase